MMDQTWCAESLSFSSLLSFKRISTANTTATREKPIIICSKNVILVSSSVEPQHTAEESHQRNPPNQQQGNQPHRPQHLQPEQATRPYQCPRGRLQGSLSVPDPYMDCSTATTNQYQQSPVEISKDLTPPILRITLNTQRNSLSVTAKSVAGRSISPFDFYIQN